jgi:alkylated DNA repair dioxygenase AlkB
MPAAQLALFGAPAPAQPEGFAYRPEVISPAEEQALAARFEDLPFKPYEFRGYNGHRLTVAYGWRYAADGRTVQRVAPIPDFLLPARAAVAAFAGLEPEALEQALIIRYPPGAPIGWHRDRPHFDKVMGLSLLTPAVLRLRLKQGEGWRRAAQTLEPRSAYLLSGPARRQWEHSIAPLDALRYSITLRTIAA